MMEENGKKMTLPIAFLIMLIIVAMIMTCIKTGVGIVVPLFLSWLVVYIFCRILGFDFDKVFGAGMDAFRKAGGAMTIMISVGFLVGAMISAGTIPAFIYYGLQIINPKIFLFCCVIITMIMALATGTSYGSAASAGIALMGVGEAMGMPSGMIAAAVLTGALFGDRISPLSDIPVLCSGLVDCNLFKNIRYSLWTSVPPLIISCIIFLVMGTSFGDSNYNATTVNVVLDTLSKNFIITPIALIPVVVVIILLIMKIPSVPAIFAGAVASALVAIFYQGHGAAQVFMNMYSGYKLQSGVAIVDKLLNRGGLTSMTTSIYILISAVTLGGMLDAIGVIGAFINPVIQKINSQFKVIAATMGTSLFINAIGSAAWLSNILTAKLMMPLYKQEDMEPEILARTMEDGYIFGTIIFPWHAMTIYFTGVLGCTWASYMPYLFFNYLTPIFTLAFAATGIGMYRRKKTAVAK